MQLTLYLLRTDRYHDGWGLRENAAEFRRHEARSFADMQVQVLVKRSELKQPRWIADLFAVIANPERLSTLTGRHCAALILIDFKGYQFILAYGTARHTIDLSYIQPGFGLKVVANAVAGSRIVSADTRRLGGRGRSQRTVLPSAGPLYELGIDTTEEWIKQLEGKPEVAFASAAAGADSLKLQIRDFGLSKLPDKLGQIVEKFESNEYKRDFDFLDYFRRVDHRDKATLDELGRRLNQLLREQSTDIGFASPEILEPQSVDHYLLKHRRKRSSELEEMTCEAIYTVLNQWRLADPLHDVRVQAVDSSGEVIGENRLLDYIVAEIPIDSRRYTLAAGAWLQIDQSYMEALQRRIEAIPDVTAQLSLPPWNLKSMKDEGVYNDSLEPRGWRVLDRHNFPIEKPNQKVEVCDLLTADKQLICVKRMSKSSTLSHLFAQGLVSAELLVSNADAYQDRVLDELKTLDPQATFGSRDDWSVVYAIATSKPGKLADSLYFFSKVHLDRTVRHLNAIGVKVALARIPLQDVPRKARKRKLIA